MKKIFFILFFIPIFIAKAEIVIDYFNQVGSKNIYFGDEITFKIYCNASEIEASIQRQDGTIVGLGKRSLINNETSIKINQEIYRSSTFIFKVSCNGNENQTPINSKVLDFKILDSELWFNEESYISFIFSINGKSISLSYIFDFYISNEKMVDYRLEQLPSGIFRVYFKPNKIGNYEFKIFANYEDRNFSATKNIEIKKPFNVEIIYQNKTYLKNEKLTIQIYPQFKNEKINVSDINIFIFPNLDYNIYQCLNTYCIDVLLNFDEGKEALIQLKFLYKGYEEIKNINVKIGKLAKGNLNVIGRILIDGQTINTDNNGNYSFVYFPGIKNFTIISDWLTINFFNANVFDFENSIKIYFISISEFKSLNAFKIENILEFEKAIVSISYDESKIEDENKIFLLKCSNYNQYLQKCNSKWEKIPFYQNKILNIISFEAKSFSAFALAYPKKLYLDFSFSKNFYWLNEEIIINGYVKDVELNSGTKAFLEIYLNDKLIKKIESNENGLFNVILDGLNKEGKYKIKTVAKKEFFDDFELEKEIEIKAKIDLKIDVYPTTLRIGNNTIKIILENVGQKDLENLKIEINGLNIQLEKNEISLLKVNEKVEINGFVNIDKTFSSSLLSVYVFSKNEKIGEKSLIITKEEEKIVEIKEERKTGLFILPSIDFSKISLTYYIAAILAFLILIALFWKKKEEKSKIYIFKRISS